MQIVDVMFRDYVGSLRSNAAGVAVVSTRLQKAAPSDMTTEEKKALKLVMQRASEVADVLADRDRLAPARVRPLLTKLVADWTAFCEALAAKARVSRKTGHENRAQEIYTSLFPEGMTFAQTDSETAWSEGHRRLDRIAKEGFAHDLDALLGPEFLAAVTASTEELGNAIGTGHAERTTPSSTALAESLLRFGRAVGRYGRVLAASCDEEDEASVERFMKAVAPIDVHRAGMRAGNDGGSEDDGVTEPTTPVTRPTSNGAPAPAPSPAEDHA